MQENLPAVIAATQELTANITGIKEAVLVAITKNSEAMKQLHSRAGELLAKSEKMDDELDAEIAAFIKEARAEAKAMTDRRKVVTQSFDKIRSGFTLMEDVLNVKSQGSLVYALQQKRDAYAAEKLERQRKAEAERQRIARLAAQRVVVANSSSALVSRNLTSMKDISLHEMQEIFGDMTLDNVEQTRTKLQAFTASLTINTEGWVFYLAQLYRELPAEDVRGIAGRVVSEKLPAAQKELADYVEATRQDFLDRFDSKVEELKALKAAEERRKQLEEQARKAAEERRKQLEEQARKAAEERRKQLEEQARKAAEEQARREAELRAAEEEAREEQQRQLEEQAKAAAQAQKIAEADANMQALFEQKEYITAPVKAKVTKHIEVSDPAAFADIIQMWWAHEGSKMTTEALSKKLGFMVKTCEKLANNEDVTIVNAAIRYVEDVKAN